MINNQDMRSPRLPSLYQIAPFILLCSCHTELKQDSRVETKDAILTSEATIPVVVTDLELKQVVSTIRASYNGRLIDRLSSGRYTFAATTTDRFVFLEKTIGPDEHTVLPLSSDCQVLHGRITGTIVQPVSVHMWRFIESSDEKFVVMADSRGEFRACLPAGMYCLFVHGSMRSLSIPVVLPERSTIEIPAYVASKVEQVPEKVHIANADFSSFSRSLSTYRMIGLGEANHGTAEFYDLRGKLSLELARLSGLRVILLEADAIGMMTVDDYVMGQNIDIGKAVTALRFWITDIQEFCLFLSELRNFNANRPPGDQVHILGVDAQRLGPPIQLLLEHRDDLTISDQEIKLLSAIEADHGLAFMKFTSTDRLVLMTLLDRLANGGSAELNSVGMRASIAARSIRYQLGYLQVDPPVGLRDQAMAELAAYVTEQSRASQVALWAHALHVARQFDYGEKSMGQYLSEKLGAAYFPIGFLSYRGQARAWDRPEKIGVISHELPPTPPFNIESIVMRASGYPDVAWARLDRVDGAIVHWLSLPRYAREFGWYYDPAEIQVLHNFPSALAAVVVVQHAKASTPTPTGVRKAKK